MEFPLSITSVLETDDQGVDLISDPTAIMAEAELGPMTSYGSPEFFFGRLLDATEQQVLYFKHAPGVRARFRGSEYCFEELEKSGSFKLIRREP